MTMVMFEGSARRRAGRGSRGSKSNNDTFAVLMDGEIDISHLTVWPEGHGMTVLDGRLWRKSGVSAALCTVAG